MTRHGELDLLVREEGRLVVVEVKTRRLRATVRGRATGGRALLEPELEESRWAARPGRAQLDRLVRAAHSLGGKSARVDLVEVLVPPGRGAVRIRRSKGIEWRGGSSAAHE